MVHVLGARVAGPLESFAAGFAAELVRQGYAASGATQHLRFIAHLSRWMGNAGLGASALTANSVAQYLVSRRAAKCTNHRSAKALRPLFDYLGSLGILPPPEVAALDPAHALLQDYRRFLLSERGLTAESARRYVNAVRAFVVERVRVDGGELAELSAADVTAFVLATSSAAANGSKKLLPSALRSLLNWLHVEGRIPVALASCVLSVARRHLVSVPKALEPRQVLRLLASCDRRKATGRRDYAILLLLSRLGLRSGEVARLNLDDIDWRSGQFSLCGKGNRTERLPMPADIAKAILDYLRRGRPRTALGRSVFDGCLRRRQTRRFRETPRTPIATYRSNGDAARRFTAAGNRSSVATSPSTHHRDLRQDRPRCATSSRAPVARPRPATVPPRKGATSETLRTAWIRAFGGRWRPTRVRLVAVGLDRGANYLDRLPSRRSP
jgi:integrase/recombinase XerD